MSTINAYEHDHDGRIWLVGDNGSIPVPGLDKWRFHAPNACAVVHELNTALKFGRLNGGTSRYRAATNTVYVLSSKRPRRRLPLKLTRGQAKAVAVELAAAALIGASS
jgi:hypothetical protein